MRRLVAAAALLLCAAPASAQQQEPIGKYVVDVRGIFARHKQEPDIAKELDVVPANLPTRSFGFVAGAHVYPLRAGKITFGFGGHVLYGGGSRTLDTSTTTTQSSSPTLKRHFKAYASEVSFNFGHRTGYSYISGGIGRTTLYVDREDSPATNVPTRQTFHYGAGARWFTNHHTAVTFDLRWYSVAEMLPGPTYAGQPRTTLLVLSGGVAFR